MSRTSIRMLLRAVAPAAAVACLCADGRAQADTAKLESELAFARGLAKEWGFVDLADKVLAKVGSGASGKLVDQLELTKCQLLLESAKVDSTRRDELLQRATVAYEGYIAKYQFSELRPQAEAELVGAYEVAARSMALALESATGEKAVKLKESLTQLLERSISKTNELVSGLAAISPEEISEADRTRLFELRFSLGQATQLLAQQQENGAFMFQQSLKAFGELSDEAGEGSPWSLRAMVGSADTYFAMGDYEQATDFYQYVVELCIPRDRDQWEAAAKGMAPADKSSRWLFVQLATPGLVKSLSAAGRSAQAAEWGLHFVNTWKREGFELTVPLGHQALLGVARALVDAGGFVGGALTAGELEWYATPEEMAAEHGAARNQRSALDLALSQAQEVNSQNRGTTLQLRAQKVVSEIVSRPGVKVAPEVLFEAAQGEYNDRNYPSAVEGLKRVLASLDGADQAKRTELGGKVLYHLGVSYQRMERPLESAKTFHAALERFSGDPEYDVQNANGFYAVMRELKRALKGDPQVDTLYTLSENYKAKFSTATAGDIDFGSGAKLFEAKQYAEAKTKFAAVGKDSDSYEKALAFLGACELKLGNYAAADKAFDAYLNGFLKEPANAQVAGTRATRREEARATALAYWGLSLFEQAEKSGDPGAWKRLIERLDGYHRTFPGQTSFAQAALYRVMIAHLRLNDRPAARRTFEELLQTYPGSKFAGYAAQDYYKILSEARDAESDPNKKRAMLREMAENLQVANRAAGELKYPNLRREADHWLELGEWATAEEVLVRLRDSFGASEPDKLRAYVLPDLGLALVEQQKVGEAAEVLRELVRDENKRATQKTAQTYARALGGWLELEGDASAGAATKIVQVPGVGTVEALKEASELYVKLEGAYTKYTGEWFENKFLLFYVNYLWSLQDSKKSNWLQGELKSLQGSLGANFQHEAIAQPLRAKFRWLSEKVLK
jgi:outer membrane protein assembly factor BamD (BamD/ComL family)